MNSSNLHNLLSARITGRIPLTQGIVAALAVYGDDAFFCLHCKRGHAILPSLVESALAIVAEYADSKPYREAQGFVAWSLAWRD